ncbi:MAG: cytochrome c family protein [Planctomycetota bacterium]
MHSKLPTWLLAVAALLLPTTCAPDDPVAIPSGPPEPRVRLRLSGFMEGRLEPCGCAAGQLGGLPRRIYHLKQERDWDVLLEGGNVVKGRSLLDAHKLRTALTILGFPQTRYHSLALGPRDLDLPMDELTVYLEAFGIPALASDVVARDGMEWPAQAFREVATAEARVRVASLTGTLSEAATAAGLSLLPPDQAWVRAMAAVDDATFRVIMVHGSSEQARAAAKLQPKPDLIVGINEDHAEPPARGEQVDGVPLVFPGTRGRMLLDVTLARLKGQPTVTRYRVVQLAASETAKGALEDADAKAALLAHRFEVQAEGVREAMAGQRKPEIDAQYVGSKECAECHEDEYDAWQATKHAGAWTTLEQAEKGERYGWPVTHYPDCVSCHVVGYGQESGFVNPETTPELRGVGCEECHGPGSAHIEVGGLDDDDNPLLTPIPVGGWVDRCIRCHDFEQSPDFASHYAERWEKIKH